MDWLPGVGAKPIPVAAGSPWENGYIESFHSRLRDEFLERVEFEDVADARAKGSWYRREYNTVRPHSSLGYATPKEFSAACDNEMTINVVMFIDIIVFRFSLKTPISSGPKNGEQPRPVDWSQRLELGESPLPARRVSRDRGQQPGVRLAIGLVEKLYVEAGPQQIAASAPKIGCGASQGVRREVPTPAVFAPGRAPFFAALLFSRCLGRAILEGSDK